LTSQRVLWVWCQKCTKQQREKWKFCGIKACRDSVVEGGLYKERVEDLKPSRECVENDSHVEVEVVKGDVLNSEVWWSAIHGIVNPANGQKMLMMLILMMLVLLIELYRTLLHNYRSIYFIIIQVFITFYIVKSIIHFNLV